MRTIDKSVRYSLVILTWRTATSVFEFLSKHPLRRQPTELSRQDMKRLFGRIRIHNAERGAYTQSKCAVA